MNPLIKNIFLSAVIGIIFFLIQRFHLSIFKFSAFTDVVYSIYLPAGARLLAVMLFGYLGAIGIFFGWLLTGLLTSEWGLFESICIGISSGLSAYIAYFLWVKIFQISNILEKIKIVDILYLVLIVALVTVAFRALHFYLFGWLINPTILIISFVGDLLGCGIALLALKSIYFLYQELYLAHREK